MKFPFSVVSVLLTFPFFMMCGQVSETVSDCKPIPVVLDTDIGTDIDDTWALAYLLNCPELDLKMVLTSSGDTEYRAKVAAKFLEVAGRSDIPVAIGSGAGPGSGSSFQEPWVADYDLDAYPGVVHRDGVAAFIELVEHSETPVTVIAIGTLPSLRDALQKKPGIAGSIRFFGMHGSIDRGYDGEPSAEANVRYDVPAFRAMLEADLIHKEITPLDTCGQVVIGGDLYQKLYQSDRPVLKALFENYQVWAELVTWMHVDKAMVDSHSSTLFDLVAVYMAFDHRFLTFETLPIIVTDDGYTKRDADGEMLDVAMQWKDLNGFYQHVVDRLLGE